MAYVLLSCAPTLRFTLYDNPSKAPCTPVPVPSYVHAVLRSRQKEKERERGERRGKGEDVNGWILWKIAFILGTGNNQQFFRATAPTQRTVGGGRPLNRVYFHLGILPSVPATRLHTYTHTYTHMHTPHSHSIFLEHHWPPLDFASSTSL